VALKKKRENIEHNKNRKRYYKPMQKKYRIRHVIKSLKEI